jgi:hypothetical protein
MQHPEPTTPPAVRRHGRRRAVRIAAVTLAACGAGAIGASAAYAYVYTTIVDFNLTETTTTYGGGPYTVSSGNSTIQYRWTDDPDHTTAISANACADLSQLGRADIPAHGTSYYTLASPGTGTCFRLRGRTAPGAGSMPNHDGTLAR